MKQGSSKRVLKAFLDNHLLITHTNKFLSCFLFQSSFVDLMQQRLENIFQLNGVKASQMKIVEDDKIFENLKGNN
jgi:hypothetical protein